LGNVDVKKMARGGEKVIVISWIWKWKERTGLVAVNGFR